MSHEDEKGFLSNKFDDWSSEPIPNGWGNIESILEEDRRAGVPIWTWFIPLIFTFLGGVSYHIFKNTEPNLISRSIISKGLENSLTSASSNSSVKIQAESKVPRVASNQDSKSENIDKTQMYSVISKDVKVEKVGLNNLDSQIKLNSKCLTRSKKATHFEESLNDQNLVASVKSLDESGIFRNESTNQNKLLNLNTLKGEESGSGVLPVFEPEKTLAASDVVISKTTNNIQFEFLEGKVATLETSKLTKHNLERIVLPPIEEKKNQKRLSYWIGGAVGYSSRNVTINQIESKNTLRVQNISKPNESWFSQIQTHLSYNLKSWLSVFTGVQVGILNQTIQVENTSKTPLKFDRVQQDSLNFSFSPTLGNSKETRKQELIYGNVEFGIKPLFSKRRNSGPFASVVVWSVISQKISNTNSEIMEIDRAKESVDLSYRIGYQHEMVKNLTAEVFYAGFPNLIASQTPGIKVNPNLIGFGLSYKFR